ncbi:TPA: hypothetical protein KNK42_003556 [Clostridioides difficile]|uniref:Uncharacterized protein n=6 Tax=root TaxID=1 RepID=A0A0A8WFN5_9CAUD|nr:hypothetical protein [Clostridioides difficile]YP_002290940.1 hypothetical protein phiCD27_gp64 [Clostridioides phage phiCD27]YP_009195829.1 hypothetical protein PHICD505_20067 [Clostridium phage phiCD505]YP_009214262.1 hypothetical protein PHIMMP03_20078 [Clostridium phage phiMMP03]EQI29331.1 hypothetical protein QOS_2338 [Clostridioides difficile Y184]EQK81103.1 hypothetical protein QEG_2822 [Clostridioides difficile CD127]ACH91355.1 hypothetical protein [Clostridioides phage phiCD27]AM
MFNIYKVKIKTKRTLEQVRNQSVDFEYSEKGLKNTLKYYNLIDDLKVIVVKFGDEYCLANYNEEDRKIIMEAHYLLEQDEYTGCYINEYERFKKDWENGNCDGEACMVFSDDEIEIIEKLREG